MTAVDKKFLEMFETFIEEKREEILHRYSDDENVMLIQELIDKLKLDQDMLLQEIDSEDVTDG